MLKFFKRSIWFAWIAGALLVSACANDENTEALSNAEEAANPTSQAASANKTFTGQAKEADHPTEATETLIDAATRTINDVTEADFEAGVLIDFDSFKKSFFNDDIITKLKSNLEAVVAQDQEKFAEHLHESYSRHSVFFDKQNVQYMFYDLDTIKKVTMDGRVQIQVGVRFALQDSEGNVENSGLTYFFVKNKEDQWKIVNID
ncbi:hypothetical protein MKY59_03405 [Paenibacillus sp. FSL W8-0426]|uniref:hypothetical protein n=1 Tax=Paenibacillus sp. FSL W8-0426 TaxID=2921714 RepID=UPI0030D83A52